MGHTYYQPTESHVKWLYPLISRFVYICIHSFDHIHVQICSYMYVYKYEYIYICLFVYIHLPIYTCIYMHIYIYYLYSYADMYIHIHFCTHVLPSIYTYMYTCVAFNTLWPIVLISCVAWFIYSVRAGLLDRNSSLGGADLRNRERKLIFEKMCSKVVTSVRR